MTLRTPLEVALQTELPLDMGDLDQGDYDASDARDDRRESALLTAALETGGRLYDAAIRDTLGGAQ